MRVLLTEAEQRSTLAATRALGQRGVEVHVGGAAPLNQSFFSRYCAGRLRYPDPARQPARAGESLLAAVAARRYDVLLPMHEYTLLAVASRQRAFAERVALALPRPETLRQVRDKQRIGEIAGRLGLHAPLTFRPRDAEDVTRIGREIGFPCVVKPRTGLGAAGVCYARSLEQLQRICERPLSRCDAVVDGCAPLIQQLVVGETHDVDALCCHGEPRAGVTCRRLVTYPERGGRSLLSETTDAPGLREQAFRLLRHVGWHGPGEVELKIDRDGKVWVIELNPRLPGSLELLLRAGADLPYMTCRLALDGDVAPLQRYGVGVRHRWWFPYELASVVLDRPLSWQRLVRALRPEPDTGTSLCLGDPLPHAAQFVDVLGRGLSGSLRAQLARVTKQRVQAAASARPTASEARRICDSSSTGSRA